MSITTMSAARWWYALAIRRDRGRRAAPRLGLRTLKRWALSGLQPEL
ncbi:hypothetical protein ACLEEB_05455 [Lonsdalea quercina]